MESGIGWRELVMLAAALAGVYLVVALLALARLGRRPARQANVEPSTPDDLGPPFKAPPPGQVWDHPFLTPVRLPDEAAPVPTEVDLVMDGISAAASGVPATSPFAATLAATEMEAELRQLRAEIEQLRQELAEVKLARRISPLYADAAALAHRGFDARGVAEECGISVAEAELVLAMSKDEKNFDSEVGDGAQGRQHDVAG
ncbi:MAG: DUF2802 domain-containing protein [Rhodocyclales bacterium]|nr:DUF2802 domain-containing protein [Rhodocyclales bacterium]